MNMDSYGRRWPDGRSTKSGKYAEDDYSYNDSPGYGFSKKLSRNKPTDGYDFEISQDDEDFMVDSPDYSRNSRNTTSSIANTKKEITSSLGGSNRLVGGQLTKRSSIDDRAKEILEKNRSRARETKVDDDGGRFTSIEAEFAEILQGIDIPKVKEGMTTDSPSMSMMSPKGSTSKLMQESPMDSTYGDSFDISAADFEVGSIAAKRIKEKAAERGRRMSFDQSAFQSQKDASFINAKNSASPDVKGRRTSIPEGFQMSTALSSIHKSRTSGNEVDKRQDLKYGSVERSDDDIYKMLNISAVNDSYDKVSKLSQLDTESREAHESTKRSSYDSDKLRYESDDENYHKASFQANSENDHDDSNMYEESFEDAHRSDQESIDNIPSNVPKEKPSTQVKNAAHFTHAKHQLSASAVNADEDEYADDFETDHSAVPALKSVPTASAVKSSVPAVKAAVDFGALTTVEQIMQRWSNTDSNKIALDLIGKVRSNDEDDENLKRGMLPSAIESPSSINKRDSSKNDSNTNTTTEVFADMNQYDTTSQNKHEVAATMGTPASPGGKVDGEELSYSSYGSLSVSQSSPHDDQSPPLTRSNGLAPSTTPAAEANTTTSPSADALIKAVGSAPLVTSIPPAASTTFLSIPTWGSTPTEDTKRGERERAYEGDKANDSLEQDLYPPDHYTSDDQYTTISAIAKSNNNTKLNKLENVSKGVSFSTGLGRYSLRDNDKDDIYLEEDNNAPSMRDQSDANDSDDILQPKIKRFLEVGDRNVKEENLQNPVKDRVDDKERPETNSRSPKLAASTVMKLKQRKKNQFGGGNSGKRMTKRTESPPVYPHQLYPYQRAEDDPTVQALGQLVKDNTKLVRKFTSLEQELRDLRRSEPKNPLPPPLANGGVISRSSGRSNKRSQYQDGTSLLQRSKDTGSVASNAQYLQTHSYEGHDFYDTIIPALEQLKELQNQRADDKEKFSLVESDLQDLVQKLLEDILNIQSKERTLAMREKALKVKESVLETRDRNSHLNDDQSIVDLQNKLLRSEQEKMEMINELSAVREKLVKVAVERDSLKAELLRTRDENLNAIDVNLREAMGLNPHLDVAKTVKPLEKVLKELQLQRLQNQYRSQRQQKGQSTTPQQPPELGEDMISVGRKEFEDIVRDCATQERLITGFQKENERLVKLLKEREQEEQAKQAKFFDEKEELNKELNRLRNIHKVYLENKNAGQVSSSANNAINTTTAFTHEHLYAISSQKTADQLKLELEMDAKLRYANEKLAVLQKEAGEKERKLHREVDELQKQVNGMKAENDLLRNKSIDELEETLKNMQEENNRLKDKLLWHLENQKMSDESDEQLTYQRRLFHFVTEELVKKGVSPKSISSLVDRFNRKNSTTDPQDLDQSMLNKSNVVGHQNVPKVGAGRNFSDIQRIKELENTVKDLQEVIAKRFPDSVAGLIHATKVQDLQQERQIKVLETKNAALQEELDQIQQSHEKKMRGLRLEFEKMKSHYETMIANLENKLKFQTPSSTPGSARIKVHHISKPGSDNIILDLDSARARIEELRNEIERVRSFYTRKIEDMQRRFQTSMRSMKRGIRSNSNENNSENEENSDVEKAPPPPPPIPPSGDFPPQQISSIVQVYKDRLSTLERELMSTAEELGKVKSASVAAEKSHSEERRNLLEKIKGLEQVNAQLSSFVPGHQHVSKDDINRIMEDRIRLIIDEFDSRHIREVNQLRESYENRLSEVRREHELNPRTIDESAYREERDRLMVEISNERGRSASLLQEVESLRRNAQPQNLHPSLMQFQILEKQLLDVEKRLARRDQDLSAAVEDVKASHRLERSRMEVMHAQELRQKDEELQKFQHELESLLFEFQKLHNVQKTGIIVK